MGPVGSSYVGAGLRRTWGDSRDQRYTSQLWTTPRAENGDAQRALLIQEHHRPTIRPAQRTSRKAASLFSAQRDPHGLSMSCLFSVEFGSDRHFFLQSARCRR
jgi:hypothetical protein